jgi:tetratricopeptide (TPR) repeat protein
MKAGSRQMACVALLSIFSAAAIADSDTFETIRKRADQARTAGHLEEAAHLYTRAVQLRPSWAEGHWHLGTIFYETENAAACRDAFSAVVRLQPKNADAWAFKGLCRFRLKTYAAALADLNRAATLGITDAQLKPVAQYHRAMLLTRAGEHERALQIYGDLARAGHTTPMLVDAMGIAVLRLQVLPDELPSDTHDAVTLAGRATLLAAGADMSAAARAFDELAGRYANTPNVHYVYGLFLLRSQPERALEQFNEELRISPDHAGAMIQLAQESMKAGDLDAAAGWATRAVQAAPRNFVGRRVLGQIKLERNDLAGAISELETAARLEPDSPSVHYTLARAYQRAGRIADANRERATFSRLERLQQEQRGAKF